MYKIYTLGEALIDFIPEEKAVALKSVSHFERVPGGAPANVAAGIAKLGGHSAFIGKVGEDAFGHCIIDALKECGVDTSLMLTTKECGTALAFVTLDQHGDRDFAFYRNPAADMLLSPEEIDAAWFGKDDILHFGSVDLIEAPVKYAHIKAIDAARAAGALISFDPNVRLPLWPTPEDCRKAILEFLPLADLVKISDDELPFITGIENPEEAITSLFTGAVKTVVLTKGPAGAVFITPDFKAEAPGIPVTPVDTTGAGDAFVAALLYQLSQRQIRPEQLKPGDALELLEFANAAGAITTQAKGAIGALPGVDAVLNQLKLK